ncbi:MAG: hypothetical protein RLZZ175_1492 [Bacteroidota bacterium]|jgi:integrase
MKYKFLNPLKIKVNTRISEEDNFIDVSGEVWSFYDGGVKRVINWHNFELNPYFKEIAKGFISNRLQIKSLRTVYGNDMYIFTVISTILNPKEEIWSNEDFITIAKGILLRGLKHYFSFISFYSWCLNHGIDNFSNKTLKEIKNINKEISTPYSKALLYPNYLTQNDEVNIINHLNVMYKSKNYIEIRNAVILNISFELGLRPIQIYSIDKNDFDYIETEDGDTKFFTLNILMAKKTSNTAFQYKKRSISDKLGKQIKRLISFKENIKSIEDTNGIFLKIAKYSTFKRLNTKDITKIISNELKKIGFKKGEGATLLRHHLAQSLADQGTPAEMIAEILGHNSTVPARAYISATPEIATIKTKALGKNETYNNIMDMLNTGNIIEKVNSNPKQWVKGMVGDQYIGGIGSCGLAENTFCAKNPVYACYNCEKFHPFIDGKHEEVKMNLENKAQYFLDIASSGMDLEHNRSVLQLETIIKSVDVVIEKCNNLKKSNLV